MNVGLLSTLCACGIGLTMIYVLVMDMFKCSALTVNRWAGGVACGKTVQSLCKLTLAS